MKIAIDAGHGGMYSGRVVTRPSGHNLSSKSQHAEKDINLELARQLAARLRMIPGVEVTMLREADVHYHEDLDKDLAARADMADMLQVDLLLSIHCNGFDDPSVRGFEVFTTPGETLSDAYAEAIYLEVEQTGLTKMRPDESDGDHDREANFAVLRGCLCPAVLIEFGFLTNDHDFGLVTWPPSRGEICGAVAAGVGRVMGARARSGRS